MLAEILAAVERNRGRLWALCYRMTGSRADADDLTQETIARAIERCAQFSGEGAVEGWLFRIATTLCLDHGRHRAVERRVNELVDPIDLAEAFGERGVDARERAILRDDLRYAIVVALQHLSPKQRAALILHDVCERSAEEVGLAIGIEANAVKSLLHRARASLARARMHGDVDVPVDRKVVERLASAIEAGSIDALAELFAEEVWGIVDGGGVVQTATRPTFGRRAVTRQWANAKRRLGLPVACELRAFNGEPAVLVRVPTLDHQPIALVHVESRDGQVLALRVNRDPAKLRALVAALQ